MKNRPAPRGSSGCDACDTLFEILLEKKKKKEELDRPPAPPAVTGVTVASNSSRHRPSHATPHARPASFHFHVPGWNRMVASNSSRHCCSGGKTVTRLCRCPPRRRRTERCTPGIIAVTFHQLGTLLCWSVASIAASLRSRQSHFRICTLNFSSRRHGYGGRAFCKSMTRNSA